MKTTATIVNEAMKLVGSENNGEKREDWEIIKARENKAKSDAFKKDRWDKICPPLYRQTDRQRIENKDLLKDIMNWNPVRGLNLCILGPTGKQKTRMAFLLLEKLLFINGYSVEAINAVELGMKLSRQVWDGKEEELERISRYQVLLIDDLGKEPDTQTISQYLYLLVEKRYSHNKQTIITANESKEKETQRPIYRRLMENALVVEVV